MRKRNRVRFGAVAVVLGGAAALAAMTAPTSSGAPAGSAASCSLNLRIGDVLPFTGDLAAYGANLDKAVKLAVNVQNTALKQLGLSGKIKVKELISRRYSLDEINEGFDRLGRGEVARGVIVF